jgi:hypothetical protein
MQHNQSWSSWCRVGILGLTSISLMAVAGCCQTALFRSDVDTPQKPWTRLDFCNNPDNFHFAIVADRNGGAHAGVFESAVDKLNLLKPEFVMSVGDFIAGYTTNEVVGASQWDEFQSIAARFEMPFFYLPGNHDNLNPVQHRLYEERFGRSYYAFVYRNVLFMTLDSQDNKDGSSLSPKQVQWAIETLGKHPDVRWTLVFMHQPLWIYEEGDLRTARKNVGEARACGFSPIQKVLASRPYTVFAGHFHEYTKFQRLGRNYYMLGTTGGDSALRGPGFGEFNHAVWVTMTPQGPVMANLTLDGILPEDVHTEEQARMAQDIALTMDVSSNLANGAMVSLCVTNPFKHQLHAAATWEIPEREPWSVDPASAEMDVPVAAGNRLTFVMRYTGENKWPVPPTCQVYLAAGSEFASKTPWTMALPYDSLLRANPAKTIAPRISGAPPVIDGTIEDDAWKNAAVVTDFRKSDMRPPSAPTKAWLAYDADALYIAFRCDEPSMQMLQTNVKERDGNVFEDDSVEIMLGVEAPTNNYMHVAVNAIGTLFDALSLNDRAAFNGHARVAASRDANGWTVEVAIPWADRGGMPAHPVSLELARSRRPDGSLMQYPPLNGWNHRHELHGQLELAAP